MFKYSKYVMLLPFIKTSYGRNKTKVTIQLQWKNIKRWENIKSIKNICQSLNLDI